MTIAKLSDKFKDDDGEDDGNEFKNYAAYRIVEVENGYTLEEDHTGKTYCFGSKFDLMNHLNHELEDEE